MTLTLLFVAGLLILLAWVLWGCWRDAQERDRERQARREQLRRWRANNRRDEEWWRIMKSEDQ